MDQKHKKYLSVFSNLLATINEVVILETVIYIKFIIDRSKIKLTTGLPRSKSCYLTFADKLLSINHFLEQKS